MASARPAFAALALVAASSATGAEAARRIDGHSHNDYLQPRPLFDALDHHMGSVEADIFLAGNELLVAHQPEATKPDRTLRTLYLDPLRELAKKRGGRIYPDRPLILLVDFK